MKLSELISAYGDDKVVFQKLDDCVVTLDMTKHGTKASFVTPERFDMNGFERFGLIVWMDRDKISSIAKTIKE